MRRKKSLQEMSIDELMALVQHHEEMRQRRNARRRERRKWLKTAPREDTALRYRAQEKPCSIGQYVEVERFVLRWLDKHPDLKEDATVILLVLAHNILHLLHPGEKCSGPRLTDCPTFSLHEVCNAALDVALNYRVELALGLTHSHIFWAMVTLTEGIDQERLHFNTLLGDISLDL